MTSRRKAKRATRVQVWQHVFVRHDDGTRTPYTRVRRWFDADRHRRLRRRQEGEVEPMMGCVKRALQNRRGRGGSWNGRTVDPWYSYGLISWKR